jgi:hypothetical protein
MPRLKPFQDELPLPDVVHPLSGTPGSHYLSIAAKPEKVRLHHDLEPADVWAYRLDHGQIVRRGNGTSYLGPTIEVKRGEPVTVAWKNEIGASHKLPFEVIKVPNPDAATTLPVPENEPGRDNALPDAQDPILTVSKSARKSMLSMGYGKA